VALPETIRLNWPTGFTGKAAISRQTRPSFLVLSTMALARRYAHSPLAIPPRPVLTMSFHDLGCVSPQHSQT
jgi:hypothetical protein